MSGSRLAIVGLVVVLGAACSDPRSSAPGAQAPSGTVLGQAFTPVDSAAEVGAPADCGGTFVSKLVLGFSDTAGLCDVGTDACARKASATAVAVIIERYGAAAQAAIVPGTYPVGTTTDASGQLLVAAYAGQNDAACATTGSASALSGTIRIDAIDASRVTGALDVAFSGGGTLRGPFDAGACPGAYDTCNGDVCTGATVCVP